MRLHIHILGFYTLLIIFSTIQNPINAHFFPNISSIPRALTRNSTAPWDNFKKYINCHSGQKLAGISNLKAYFRRFGYINGGSNFTDDFDDALESAVKTYQLNFNLKSTGVLDSPTIEHLIKPRCGNADIINSKPSSNGTVAHYSFFPGRPIWPPEKRDLTYSFSPENNISGEVKAVFARAFDRWSEVTPLTFTESGSYPDSDIRVGFYSGSHGDDEAFDGSMGMLAHAFSPPIGRIHFDADEIWVIDGDFLSAGGEILAAADLESVAVHEIGHLLGLGHSSIEEAIMYPSLDPMTRKVELSDDDVQGVQELYGSNPNGTLPELTPSNDSDSAQTGGGSAIVAAHGAPVFFLVVGVFAVFL